jgi:intracellular sulfur oxidation DsrE/DsrF family protein
MTDRKLNRRALVLPIAIGALSPLVGAAQQVPKRSPAAKRQKLVLQVSDADQGKWELVLNNAKNVQSELGVANVDIEIVAYGPGIDMLKFEAPTASRVADALKTGIKVVACENTMHGQKLTKDDMQTGIGFTPAAVTEIMRLQQAGWCYIRP